MENKRSIFQCAAEWGIPFGIYLTCAAVASIFADWFAPLRLIFLVLLLGTPFVVYYFQRRKFIEDNGFTEYAAIWMLGIMLFIFGSIIAGVIVYFVLQYGRPNYMYEQAQEFIRIYGEMPEMKDSDLLLVIKRMYNERLMPTPIEMVFNAFWFVTFSGSITSAITALVARRRLMRRNNSQHQ